MSENVYTWDGLSTDASRFLRSLVPGEFISLRYDVVRMFGGDGTAAILFTDLLHWSTTQKAMDADGWFYRTSSSVTQKMGIARKPQERVRRLLIDMGIMEVGGRVGTTGKNYYRLNLGRVYALLAVVPIGDNEMPPSGTTSCTLSGQPDVPKGDNIVNEEVDEGVEVPTNTSYSVASPPPRRVHARKSRLHVFDAERLAAFPRWAVRHYPRTPGGLGATEELAERIITQLGTYVEGDEAGMTRAQKRVDEFIAAIKNIEAAVSDGSYSAEYIPRFVNFCGLKHVGQVASYKEWAARKPAERKKRSLVV